MPGVPGVGEKTGIQLLQEFKTLDGIYENLDNIKPTTAKKLEAGKELAYMSKKVGEIWCDAPVELDWDAADINGTDLNKVAAILKKFEFTSLIKRLPKHMQQVDQPALFIDEPDVVKLKEIAWPKTLEINGPLVVHIQDGELWVSLNNETVTHKPISELDNSMWRALEFGTVISYDVKKLYHDLAALDVKVHFGEIHDVRQAAFLVDPLRRDRSLAALLGGEVPEPADYVAGLWQVYKWQSDAFKHEPRIADIAHRFDFPLTYMLFRMEHKGIKIDKDLLAKMSVEHADPHKK